MKKYLAIIFIFVALVGCSDNKLEKQISAEKKWK